MNRVNKITHLAMMLALTVVLSIFESSLPSFVPIPGVKLGLANIAVMYGLIFYGKKEAILLNVAKAFLGGVTRGFVAGILSFCGGLLSIIVIIFLLMIFKDKISYIILSISGAIFHNLGQLMAVFVIFDNYSIMYYLPILVISGVIMGTLTGILIKALIPVIGRIGGKNI
ncbi:MAG: Gx transporter family protein [Lachnospirales bacterium]